MSPQITKAFVSAGLGLFMVVLFWITYFLSLPFLGIFFENADEVNLDLASAVRTSIYTMLVVMSPQVWVFSTLYFFDRKRK
jgi:hypothetical protein